MLYIDYGNRATVPKTKLGTLPGSFHTPSGYAKLYSIALIKLPSDEEMSGQGIQALKEDLLDKSVKINVEYKYESKYLKEILFKHSVFAGLEMKYLCLCTMETKTLAKASWKMDSSWLTGKVEESSPR